MTKPMTPERLQEIKARYEAATGGEVFSFAPEDCQTKEAFLEATGTVWDETVKLYRVRPYYAIGYSEQGLGVIVALCGNGPKGKANSEFLAHSFQDLPDCHDEIERLQKLIQVAKCPNCDGSGGYYDNYGNACQCQWCDEVKALET